MSKRSFGLLRTRQWETGWILDQTPHSLSPYQLGGLGQTTSPFLVSSPLKVKGA